MPIDRSDAIHALSTFVYHEQGKEKMEVKRENGKGKEKTSTRANVTIVMVAKRDAGICFLRAE